MQIRILTILFFTFPIICTTSQNYKKNLEPNPTIPAPTRELSKEHHESKKKATLLDIFCAPIIFSDAGFRCYIKHRYNRPEYSDFLSLYLNDILQFLSYGQQFQSREYAKRILSLFHKKLKSSSYVNAFSFEDLLKEMPITLEHLFEPPRREINSLKEYVNKFLYTEFLYKFDEFKQEPESFLEHLSQSITTMALEELQSNEMENVSKEELRCIILRFLEHALGKLIWSPEEDAAVWESVKSIGQHLQEFGHKGIFIYEEDLDDLHWSLVSRFGYFIDLAGAQLSQETYQRIINDIQNGELDFLSTEEQEEHIETKQEYLIKMVKKGTIKAQVFSMGYINEILP